MSPVGRFITLEEFIIDTFSRVGDDGVERPVDRPDEIGGGGTYAIMGARIFLPPARLGMVVDHTPATLPQSMRAALLGYGPEMWCFRERTDGQGTTRSVNRYRGEVREFEYLSQPTQPTPVDIMHTSVMNPLPSSFHYISYPDRGLKTLDELDQLRKSRGGDAWAPRILWEPEPHSCIPENLKVIRAISSRVDIVSPNHTEVLSLLSLSSTSDSDEAIRDVLARACRIVASWRPRLATIIRCGPLGACYLESGTDEVCWVPAYWQPDMKGYEEKLVDPTGCGNAFMGGVGAALEEGQPLLESVIWGSVAASFMLEQHGLPSLSRGKGGEELWNGEAPSDRVDKLRERIQASSEAADARLVLC